MEVYANAKRLASDVAYALATYDSGPALEEVVAGLDAVADPDRLAQQVCDLHEPGTWLGDG